jgi:hypothetical protein
MKSTKFVGMEICAVGRQAGRLYDFCRNVLFIVDKPQHG